MDRNTRKILQYISDMEKQAKQMSYVKDLKKEVILMVRVRISIELNTDQTKERW
jgi:hypothetical protein